MGIVIAIVIIFVIGEVGWYFVKGWETAANIENEKHTRKIAEELKKQNIEEPDKENVK